MKNLKLVYKNDVANVHSIASLVIFMLVPLILMYMWRVFCYTSNARLVL